MAPEQMVFQRARRPEHKQQRYDAILAAARALALQNSVRDVSLADIAAEVGMHKSALLRYFTTRDEIYLHLAARDWQDWAEAIARALADAPTGSTGDVAGALTRTWPTGRCSATCSPTSLSTSNATCRSNPRESTNWPSCQRPTASSPTSTGRCPTSPTPTCGTSSPPSPPSPPVCTRSCTRRQHWRPSTEKTLSWDTPMWSSRRHCSASRK